MAKRFDVCFTPHKAYLSQSDDSQTPHRVVQIESGSGARCDYHVVVYAEDSPTKPCRVVATLYHTTHFNPGTYPTDPKFQIPSTRLLLRIYPGDFAEKRPRPTENMSFEEHENDMMAGLAKQLYREFHIVWRYLRTEAAMTGDRMWTGIERNLNSYPLICQYA